jgi:hypothetical protein
VHIVLCPASAGLFLSARILIASSLRGARVSPSPFRAPTAKTLFKQPPHKAPKQLDFRAGVRETLDSG